MKRIGLLVMALLGLLPRPLWAAARELDWHLVYRVPRGCPESDAFLARLDEQVAEGGSNYLDGRIVIERISKRVFRLRMQFNGGRRDELLSEDCAALVDAAVRTAGLARTDSPSAQVEALLRRNQERAPETRDEHAKSPATPVVEMSVAEAFRSTPSPEREPEREPAPPAHETPALNGPSPSPWQPSILGQALYLTGALPQPSLGAGLRLAVSHAGVQARLEATLWPSQPWTVLPGPRPVTISLRQRSAALGLCSELFSLEPSWGRLLVNGCVRGALMSLESLASEEYRAGSTQYGVFGSRLGLMWSYSWLVLELLGGLDVTTGKRTLGPDTGGDSFVAHSSQLSASLALGWQWGASGSGKGVSSAE
jgi:hypothetical protein